MELDNSTNVAGFDKQSGKNTLVRRKIKKILMTNSWKYSLLPLVDASQDHQLTMTFFTGRKYEDSFFTLYILNYLGLECIEHLRIRMWLVLHSCKVQNTPA